MTRTIVDLPWVLETKTAVSNTCDRMRESSGDVVALSSAPDVDSACTSFMNKWDERRGELADFLDGIVELLGAIHEVFSETDSELANATSEASGG